MADTDRLLTTRELAQHLHVHPKTIARWTRLDSNPLPCVHVRTRVRFDLSHVLRWVSSAERSAE